MLVTVLGASGRTGHLLTRQLVYAGHEVRALTRHHDAQGLTGVGTTVIRGDASNEDDLRRALKGAQAVVSVLGTPYSKEQVRTYSDSAGAITRVLTSEGPRRLVVTSSAVLSSWRDPTMTWADRLVLSRAVERLGATLYDDMRRMEELVAASDLDWTVMRPLGLTDMDASTKWAVAEDHIAGRSTARRDLAAAIVDQLARADFLRKCVAVATTNESVSIPVTIWREAIRPSLRRRQTPPA
ncbi:MAG: NAD(P)H-binding protein [Actinobacteria bacterium]|nr:NAD(P)H-binding protein [Actinomycetota bacterium]